MGSPRYTWRSWTPPSHCVSIRVSGQRSRSTAPRSGKSCWRICRPDEQERILPELDLKRPTPNSVGNLQELKAELYRVRKNGYACDLEEHELHIRCVAAPIWDHTGSVQSSLSLTAPTLRMPVTRLRQLAPVIQAAGRKISAELGYEASPLPQVAGRNRNGKAQGAFAKVAV